MNLLIPDEIVSRAEANASELRVALAIQLYSDNRIDHSDACRLAHLSEVDFSRELISRTISVQQYPKARPCRSAG